DSSNPASQSLPPRPPPPPWRTESMLLKRRSKRSACGSALRGHCRVRSATDCTRERRRIFAHRVHARAAEMDVWEQEPMLGRRGYVSECGEKQHELPRHKWHECQKWQLLVPLLAVARKRIGTVRRAIG